MPSEGLFERYINFYTDFALSLKDYRDYYNTIVSAEERGRAEGREEVEKIGENKEKI